MNSRQRSCTVISGGIDLDFCVQRQWHLQFCAFFVVTAAGLERRDVIIMVLPASLCVLFNVKQGNLLLFIYILFFKKNKTDA